MQRFTPRPLLLLSTFLFLRATTGLRADDTPAESAVPKGEVTKFTFDQSKIFPGTVRDYWIYVPKQYDPANPACLYVNQDGIQYRAPEVFDDLIHKKEMPVVIGVFVTPGRVKAHFQRSARSLQSQLRVRRPGRRLRSVFAGRAAARSREENDSGRPADPAVARRQRPLHRRRQQRRDLRVHGRLGAARCVSPRLQRDRHLCRPARRQRISNLDPQVRAQADPHLSPGRQLRLEHLRRRLVDGQPGDGTRLPFAGYEVNHDWGTGGHSGDHATKIFADAMRWLWKDWPAPVKAGLGSQQLQEILIPGEDWTLGRRRLSIHRRARPQCPGRGLFQRHSQQQGLQDRTGRQCEPVHCRY